MSCKSISVLHYGAAATLTGRGRLAGEPNRDGVSARLACMTITALKEARQSHPAADLAFPRARVRPLFDLFRLLHPQVRTFMAMPPFVCF